MTEGNPDVSHAECTRSWARLQRARLDYVSVAAQSNAAVRHQSFGET